MKFLCAAALLIAAFSTTANAADPAAGQTKAAVCAGCHGTDGKAIQPAYPHLAGQGAAYIVKQMQEFKSGARENAVMAPMAAPLSDEDIADIAAFYESLPAIQGVASEENLTAGQDIYRGGITAAGIPACSGCHGPAGEGNPAAAWPALSGLSAEYVTLQLEQFRSGARANDPGNMMRATAKRMTDAEIAAVANYIQGLK